MLKLSLIGILAFGLLINPQEQEDAKNDDPLKGVKCCIMTKANVKKEQTVAYRDGNVYFCCARCKGNFEKDKAKYAVQANQQLVQTEQYVQKACPISGQATDDAQSVKIGETEVHFCCGNCVAKVNGESDDAAKAKLVFGDEAFEKAFAKAEASDESKDSGGGVAPAPAPAPAADKTKKSGL